MTGPDVLVIGAGPGGSTAAGLLAQAGWDVLLVDRATFPRPKTCGDGLTPRALATIGRLDHDLLDRLLAGDFQRVYGGRIIAPDGTVLDLSFTDCLHDLPPLGLVVPRAVFDDLLRRHAVAGGARFWDGAPVTELVSERDRIIRAVVQRGEVRQHIAPRLVIVATGASIRLLKRLGVVRRMPPAVRAARAYYEGVTGLGARFQFHFPAGLLPGYVWAFPIGPATANVGVGFFLGAPRGHPSPGAFLRRLEGDPTPGHWLASARRTGPIEAYPVRTDYPGHRVHGANWLLVGEAAGLANPITGEGIDLAMESGMLAAEVADAALRAGDLSVRALGQYDRALRGRFGLYFRAARWMQRVIMTRPALMNKIVRRAVHHPELAVAVAQVASGVDPPWLRAALRNWWRIL